MESDVELTGLHRDYAFEGEVEGLSGNIMQIH
jgi:hypothetical protein